MPTHLHLDFETFSKVDLNKTGGFRYAFDESSEILCAAMALGDEPPMVWHRGLSEQQLEKFEPYWDALENPEVLIYAFNAPFEYAFCLALMEKTFGIKCPDISRFRCTQSMARRASLPAKLEKLAEALNLTNLKDKRGKALIKKFSEMQKAKPPTKKFPDGQPARRIMPEDEPEAFAEFLEYCGRDVLVEQEATHKLAYFDDALNNANFTLHLTINARGTAVNVEALRHARKLIDEETEIQGAAFRAITGFEMTQNKLLLAWVKKNGCDFGNLQAETIDTFLEEWDSDDADPSDVTRALRIKQSTAYVSIKKVGTMLSCAGDDNRIRGLLNHHGATTGRSTSSLVQFQNLKRPSIKDHAGNGTSEAAYADICAGVDRETLDLTYGPPLEVISSCVRHFVDDRKPILDADYAAIEARIVCWLAGQEDALEEYRQGIDRYEVMASLIYGVPVDQVNKHPQRFVGKQAVLGCGFGMGPAKFRGTCKQMGGYDLPLGLENTAVKAFRAKHKKVKAFWGDLEHAAKQAIVNKGKAFTCGHLKFICRDLEGMPFLLMRLPSGRKLAYPKPKIVAHRKFEGQTAIVFWGHIKGALWGNVETWGGTLVENATQAVAADIMLHGTHNAERQGYETMTLIHDQALAYHKPHQTVEEFVKLLTDLPPWADGLPIEAEGKLANFYSKD